MHLTRLKTCSRQSWPRPSESISSKALMCLWCYKHTKWNVGYYEEGSQTNRSVIPSSDIRKTRNDHLEDLVDDGKTKFSSDSSQLNEDGQDCKQNVFWPAIWKTSVNLANKEKGNIYICKILWNQKCELVATLTVSNTMLRCLSDAKVLK